MGSVGQKGRQPLGAEGGEKVSKKKRYEAPRIIEEKSFETHAIACNKIPGIGDPNYCGPVWSGLSGKNTPGCKMSDLSRSS